MKKKSISWKNSNKKKRFNKELFKNKGDMRIWISETKERLPIKIQIKIQYGSMPLTLVEIN